ncbi:hypothetical protein [Streptomyces sp. NBC_00354]|uniref:hypothetical protein n=1 Tax=Streptomyces sp. NBC_00354 TaxID=2975723 RepID=UPI002E26CE5E
MHRHLGEGEPAVPLELVSCEAFEPGVLNLFYAPAERPGSAGYEDAKSHLPRTGG